MNAITERKLTTILSADAVGYSRLMGQDESGTFTTLKAYRELTASLIASHRGQVVNTAGDSILADFPSVVRAVECAIEIQRAIAERNAALSADKRMWFRVGINLGDVMVDKGDLFGDGVNVAARLQAMADPGGILISGTVFDHVKDKLTVGFDALGAQVVKNIPAQVSVYRVLLEGGAQPAPDEMAAAPARTGTDPREVRRHKFVISTATAGSFIAFFFLLNLATGSPLWAIWPSIPILLLYALRTIALFRKRLD
jgi:adenylate cyclase